MMDKQGCVNEELFARYHDKRVLLRLNKRDHRLRREVLQMHWELFYEPTGGERLTDHPLFASVSYSQSAFSDLTPEEQNVTVGLISHRRRGMTVWLDSRKVRSFSRSS